VSFLGHPTMGYFWLLMLTLGPQLIAHTGFNYVVGYLPATLVSMSTLTVTVGATMIAFLLFSEVPTIWHILGSIIIIVGVAVAILGQNRARKSKASQ
jgi:drug/metabolite transporter (DMT)-like permease